jgi:hypothetical protein
MKTMILLLSLFVFAGCTTASKNPKTSPDKIQKENLNVEKEIKINMPTEGLRAFQKEKIAFINVHDFPDSALLSAKTKMNPPDLAIDEAKLLQMDRAEILRQAIVTFCDSCQNFEVILPIEKLSESQFNFFFDKIFLRQEVNFSEISELTGELADYDKLVLVLSSEDYEKNRGFNKDNEVVAFTEVFIKSEVYVFDLKKKSTLGRMNISLSNKDNLFYEKKELTDKVADKIAAKKLKEVKDVNIKTVLNDVRYDEVYPYPIASESITLFQFFYNELCKSIFMDHE